MISPELKRNLWLELTSSRVLIMTAVIALISIAVLFVNRGSFNPLGWLGIAGFNFITIFWGSRNAARSVIGEIRERTWDFQRLSAMTPISMAMGKLFGATAYTWYGGVLCLLIALPAILRTMDVATAVMTVVLLLATGVLAHAVALGSALAAARRRQSARLSVLPHQAMGLVAAYGTGWLLAGLVAVGMGGDMIVPPENELSPLRDMGDVRWLGASYDGRQFTTLAMLSFALWAVLGTWRQMRLELMEMNAPVFWPLFLVFLAVFLAGFGDSLGTGLLLAYFGVHVAAMLSLFAEPKNAVELRSLGDNLVRGRLHRVLVGLPAYGWAFVAAAVLVAAIVRYAPSLDLGGEALGASMVIAALGFLARDIGVLHVFHAKPRQTRGDFAGLVALALLYVLGATVASPVDEPAVTALVRPTLDGPAWAAALPWAEAVVAWALAITRFRGARSEPAPVPASA